MQVMSTQFKDHHHYKGEGLTRSEKVERIVVEILLSSKLSDSKSESSKVWELKHSSGCCQIARILAEKRGLNIEIAEVSAILHDIYVIKTGKYQNHAAKGAPLAKKILKKIGGFGEKEINLICTAIAHHSEKEIHTHDPYVELVKDVDVFDCSLYKGAEGYYRTHKLQNIVEKYIERIRKVRKELSLSATPVFRE